MKRVVAIFSLIGLLMLFNVALAQSDNHAGLVIVDEDGTAVTRCVAFTEPTITSYDLLNNSGLAVDVSVSGQGTTVCQIEATGCPVDDCWCQCRGGGECRYWSSWHLDEAEWQYATLGAHAYQVSDGAVDGWVWGVGTVTDASEPPAITFDEICTDAEQAESETAVTPVPTAPSWLAYGVLALIVLGLSSLLLRKR